MRGGFYGRITAVLSAIGTAWILVLMVLICADVLGRDLFKAPIPGVPEMVSFSIVGIVFLQLAQTLRAGGLTRSDVLLGALQRNHPKIGYTLEAVFALVGVWLFGLIAKTTWPLMLQTYADAEYFGNIGVIQLPVWALKAIILIGAVAVAIQFLLLAVHLLAVAAGLRAGDAPARWFE